MDIQTFVKLSLNDDHTGHDFTHAYRVVSLSQSIHKVEGGNLRIIEAAAWLHDTADHKLFSNLEVQYEKIEKLLIENNYTEKEISIILDIIKRISFSSHSLPFDFIEGKIVQDADRLEALGAIGIIRTVTYGAKLDRPFYEPDNIKLTNNHYEFDKITPSSLSHFYEKLLKLELLFNTETGKKLAYKRTKFLKQFLSEFYRELED